jgi:hypothetical protein
MPESREFRLIVVSEGSGQPDAAQTQTLVYSGENTVVDLSGTAHR